MQRKIINIDSVADPNDSSIITSVALCDDGTLWLCRNVLQNAPAWEQISTRQIAVKKSS